MWPNNMHKHADETSLDEKIRGKYKIQFFVRFFVLEKIEFETSSSILEHDWFQARDEKIIGGILFYMRR